MLTNSSIQLYILVLTTTRFIHSQTHSLVHGSHSISTLNIQSFFSIYSFGIFPGQLCCNLIQSTLPWSGEEKTNSVVEKNFFVKYLPSLNALPFFFSKRVSLFLQRRMDHNGDSNGTGEGFNILECIYWDILVPNWRPHSFLVMKTWMCETSLNVYHF